MAIVPAGHTPILALAMWLAAGSSWLFLWRNLCRAATTKAPWSWAGSSEAETEIEVVENPRTIVRSKSGRMLPRKRGPARAARDFPGSTGRTW